MVNILGEANMTKQLNTANAKVLRAVKQVRESEAFKNECAVKVIRFGLLEVLVTEKKVSYKFKNIIGGLPRSMALDYIERTGYDAEID